MARHERVNPPGLFDARRLSYSQAMRSHGTTFVQIAGQASLDEDLRVVGAGDFEAQVSKCFSNLARALAACGALPSDVNSVHLYVVGFDGSQVPGLAAALREFFGPDALPPGTLLGVQALAMPDLLLEIEATAVL
jgi:enamine deaminase RidA (YjgF/YER057c/UK114 family)